MKRFFSLLFLSELFFLFFTSCLTTVDKVELDASEITLALDSTDILHAKIIPEEIPDSILYWQSSDTSIVEVNNGIIKGKKIGSAAVIAWADDMSDTCLVNVKVRVDSIRLNVKSVRIKNGSKAKLKAVVYPRNATDTIVDWRSNDSTVAVVARGVVHAKEKGTTIISATIDGQTVSCKVTVASINEWLTDMARQAQQRGGNVGGALRFSLMWNDESDWNKDDLDAHCIEPNGNEISYKNKFSRSIGRLDVDNIHPTNGVKAIENISWTSVEKLKKNGTYQFSVHRYADRGGKSGFRAEIEFEGQVYSFDYRGKWRKKKNWNDNIFGYRIKRKVSYVPVANIKVDEEGDMYIETILTPLEK